MRRLIVAGALLALVAAACEIETNFGVVINADGSGRIVVEVGMDEEAQELLLEDVDDPFEGNELAEAPNAVRRTETRGDLMFWIVEIPVDDVTEIEDTLVGAESSVISSFEVEVTDTLVTVSGTATASEAMGEETIDPSLLGDALSFNVRITMPGKILSHNADSRDGSTLIWDIPIVGGTLNVQAESDPSQPAGGGGGAGIPIWVWILIGAVVAGGGIYLYMQRQKNQDAGRATAPSAPGAPEDMPPAPPPPVNE
jgi:hypothetical protein